LSYVIKSCECILETERMNFTTKITSISIPCESKLQGPQDLLS